MEYPVGISYLAWGASLITQPFASGPSARGPRRDTGRRLLGAAGDGHRGQHLLPGHRGAAAARSGSWRRSSWPGRTGDGRGTRWRSSPHPCLLLTGLINWDLMAVACVAGALWAWARGRPVLTGVMIGARHGDQALPAVPARRRSSSSCCARAARWRRSGQGVARPPPRPGRCVNLPVDADRPRAVEGVLDVQLRRGAPTSGRCGWWPATCTAHGLDPTPINLVSWVVFGAACVAVAVLGLLAQHPPRLAAARRSWSWPAFLLVNKVYSPQYVLWLLPLAVLARPRWRDLLIWQAGEIFYFVARLDATSAASPASGTSGRAGSGVRPGDPRSAWPASSTWSRWWCATSCDPRHDPVRNGRHARRPRPGGRSRSADVDRVERGRGEAHPAPSTSSPTAGTVAPAGRNSIDACMCGGSANKRCFPPTVYGDAHQPGRVETAPGDRGGPRAGACCVAGGRLEPDAVRGAAGDDEDRARAWCRAAAVAEALSPRSTGWASSTVARTDERAAVAEPQRRCRSAAGT